MKFAFISGGGSLFAWRRLQDEGHQVRVLIADPRAVEVGDGIVKKAVTISALEAWGGRDAIYVFDTTTEDDFTVKFGPLADAMRRRGLRVLGGGTFCDRLEGDRDFGQEMAKRIGLDLPESHSFGKIAEAIKWLDGRDDEAEQWYFKTDRFIDSACTYGASSITDMMRYLEYLSDKYGDSIPNHLERTVEGVPLSVEVWWDGKRMLFPIELTIEHKKLMNGDVGPATGCALNLLCTHKDMKFYERIKIAKWWNELRRAKAPPGLYDMNLIFTKDKVFFLEWTPRWGYDSQATMFRLLPNLGEFLMKLSASSLRKSPFPSGRAAFGVRLSVPPYPEDEVEKRGQANGLPVYARILTETARQSTKSGFEPYGIALEGEQFYVADPEGLLGVAVSTGRDVTTMNKECLDVAHSMEVPNLQYRTDADEVIKKDIEALKTVGIDIGYA